MFKTLRPWQFLVVAAAGWVNPDQHGIDPAPKRRRGMSWKTFIQAHWDTICAADFFTVEVWGLRGLVTFYVLLVIEHSSRRVHFAGATPNPNTEWMMQIAMIFFGERSLRRAITEYLAHYHRQAA